MRLRAPALMAVERTVALWALALCLALVSLLAAPNTVSADCIAGGPCFAMDRSSGAAGVKVTVRSIDWPTCPDIQAGPYDVAFHDGTLTPSSPRVALHFVSDDGQPTYWFRVPKIAAGTYALTYLCRNGQGERDALETFTVIAAPDTSTQPLDAPSAGDLGALLLWLAFATLAGTILARAARRARAT